MAFLYEGEPMKHFLILFFILLIFLPACGPIVEPTVIIIPTTESPTQHPTGTNTPIPPTETQLPSTNTPTPTSTATQTMIPTSAALFDQIQILGGYYNEGNSIIYLSFPRVDKNYKFKMDQHEYDCMIDEEYKDRVNCYGRFLDNQKSKSAFVQIYDPTSLQLVFEKNIYIPMTIPTPTPVGEASTWCPLRGQNVTCETEWRTENDEICVVMSCFDACGYYYSEHTCKLPPNNNAIIQPTPTPF